VGGRRIETRRDGVKRACCKGSAVGEILNWSQGAEGETRPIAVT